MKCRKCDRPARVVLHYSGLSLCEQHYVEYFAKRVCDCVERYRMLRGARRVVLAISGGKDSAAMAHVMVNFFKGLEFVGLHIDLGIPSYSDASLRAAKNLAKLLGLPLVIVPLRDNYGFTIEELHAHRRALLRPICSICGMVKRYILNAETLALRANVLAVGHNLDDEFSVALHNMSLGDFEALRKGGPVLPEENGFARRIKPLYESYESEARLYAQILKLPSTTVKCPYSKGATTTRMKEATRRLEELYPGFKLRFMRFYVKKLKPLLVERAEGVISRCAICGMPTSGTICSFCRLRSRVEDVKRKSVRAV
ncbi:MAG: TIGR00269 family protein [Candidatus Verstraetearchaeota archaeon]|nr:TIGR00269 family protein [Candidatus Verstraetearchaeota archaeon]